MIEEQASEVAGDIVLGAPTKQKKFHKVPLLSRVVRALEWHQARVTSVAGLVFMDTEGGPMRQSNFERRSYKPLIKAAGLRHVKFHGLRHGCASYLLASGASLKDVQEWLGHSGIAITGDLCAHLLPGALKKAAEKMDAHLAESQKPRASGKVVPMSMAKGRSRGRS